MVPLKIVVNGEVAPVRQEGVSHAAPRAPGLHADQPRASAALLAALVQRAYSAHVRELVELLWRAVTTSMSGAVELAATRAAPRTRSRTWRVREQA